MKKIIIEWKHLDKKGNTCERCSKTGEEIQKAIKELSSQNVSVTYKETKLSEKDIDTSNTVLINNFHIEDLVKNTKKNNHRMHFMLRVNRIGS